MTGDSPIDIESRGTSGTASSSRRHACNICERRFLKQAHLRRHLGTHVNDKPYSCQHCSKAFARADACARHEKTVHAPKRPRLEGNDEQEISSTGSNIPVQEQAESGDAPDGLLLLAQQQQSISETGAADFLTQYQPIDHDYALPALSRNHLSNVINFDLSPIPPEGETHDFMASFSHYPLNGGSQRDDLFSWLTDSSGFDFLNDFETMPGPAFLSQHPSVTSTTIGVPSSALYEPSTGAAQLGPHIIEPARSARPFQQSSLFDSEAPVGQASTSHGPLSSSGTSLPGTLARPHALAGNPTRLQIDRWQADLYDSTNKDASYASKGFEQSLSRPGSRHAEDTEFTSPEQIVEELRSVPQFLLTPSQDNLLIPTIAYMDTCLQLYFRDFHPSFPVIHKATFSRARTPPLLLLSMCSIGCMFIGTQSAVDRGLDIYHRVQYAISVTRDSRMTTEKARIAVCLSGLLGQCFSFLSGETKHLLTAESSHGCQAAFMRKTGILRLVEREELVYDDVVDLDGESLNTAWVEWASDETLKRASLALTIQAAELTAYSSLGRLVPAKVPETCPINDDLFNAEGASEWRELLQQKANRRQTTTSASTTTHTQRQEDLFFPSVILAQKMVGFVAVRDIAAVEPDLGNLLPDPPTFYHHMTQLLSRLNIRLPPSEGAASARDRSLRVLWHYCCLHYLTRMDIVEKAVGRDGPPTSEAVQTAQEWSKMPEARLAALHAGFILQEAQELRDMAFLIPRAIFQATLLLCCFLRHTRGLASSETSPSIQPSYEIDWEKFAGIVHMLPLSPAQSSRLPPGQNTDSTALPSLPNAYKVSLEDFISTGYGRLHFAGIVDGGERSASLIGLLGFSIRLLRRCTSWKLGEKLASILATIEA